MMRYRLENGLEIVLIEDPCSTLFTFSVNVRVGADQERRNFGISHLVEHLMFQGTETRKPFDIVNDIEGAGGYINAETSRVNTFYYATILKEKRDVAVDVLFDIINNSLFSNDSVKSEKNVVLAEIRDSDDRIENRVDQLITENLIGKPRVLGTRRSVKSINRKKILDFYNRWYVPRNMTLITIGNYEDLNVVVDKFSKMKDYGAPVREKVEPINRGLWIDERLSKEIAYVSIVFPNKGIYRREYLTFDVIDAILSRPMSGRLNVETRLNRQLLYSISSGNYNTGDYGLFEISYSTQEKNLELIEKIVIEQIDALKDVSNEDFSSSKTFIKGVYNQVINSNIPFIRNLAYWDSVSPKGIEMFLNYIKDINSISKKDISIITKKYLSGDYFKVSILPKK